MQHENVYATNIYNYVGLPQSELIEAVNQLLQQSIEKEC